MANEQDISVFDKENPVLGATTKEQDMNRLQQQVVPVGAFTDPHNPYTASLSVNLPLADAPLQHSEDYGRDVGGAGAHLDVTNTMSAGAITIQEETGMTPLSTDDITKLDLPEDREEWTKAHWQRAALHYGLAKSGSVTKLRERVEGFEEEQEASEERKKELHGMSREDLDALAPEYDIDPSEHSNKESLADAIFEAETGE